MKVSRQLLAIGLPAMVENLLQMLMGMVDSYLVAILGLAAVSGVSVANNVTAVYQAIFIALGAAVSSAYSARRSQQGGKKAQALIGEALLLTLFLGLVLGLFSLFFGEGLLSFLGTTPQVSRQGGLYLAIVGGGIVFLGLMTTAGSVVRSQGKPQLPMYVSLLSNLMNALLASVAIFVCHWGIMGVAFATVISRAVGFALLVGAMRYDWKSLVLSWRIDKELVHLALPAAGERLMMRVGDIAIVAIVVTFGTKMVAGNAIGETLTQFNYMPGMGLATATVILAARARGVGDMASETKLLKKAYFLSLLLMAIVSGAIFVFGQPLTLLYTMDQEAVSASLVVILYSFLGTPATAGTLVMTAMWQGLGNAKLPFYATTFGMWVIRIGLGVVLGIGLSWGLAGVWLATIADNVFRWAFLTYLYRKKVRKTRKSLA
ncbi:MATE family efflux transporter [Streptococcus sp. DD12]|uniref:MATE family efflux transporter n=1 Tax=Streptococcus sp. DD12 TaxID=1777880 RepID=UPI000798D857|nr:MATE family efflux transporter [Streptococcus sp. DD12]KXT75347.1 Multi antimicrobial extrusion (MATE) family transporter [Streptococcus sp. DD12]